MTSLARHLLAEIADDPEALAELRRLAGDVVDVVDVLLSPADVARRLGLSTRTVNRYAAEGRLNATKVGRGWRFHANDLHVRPAAPSPQAPHPAARRRPVRPSASSSLDAIRGRSVGTR